MLSRSLEQPSASPLLDVLIRAGLIVAMAMLCYQIFSPFLTLMVGALILAVTIYPLHQALTGKIGESIRRQGNEGHEARRFPRIIRSLEFHHMVK